MNKKIARESLMKALFIVTTQIVYGQIFGSKNILVGMIMAMGVVAFLNRDLTGQIIFRTTTFLILNLVLGVLSYLSVIDIWWGLVINVLTIFIITYIYMNDFRSPTSYIFIMLYIFMWASPVNLDELPYRLLALSFSIFIIILAQIIFNKGKFISKSNQIINDIVDDLQKQINDIIMGEFDIKTNIQINKKIRSLLALIDERKQKRKYNSKHEINQFNIAVCLDRLNLIINNVAKYNKDKNIKSKYLNDLKVQINNIKEFNEDKKDVNEINKDIEEFINRYDKVKNKPLFLTENIHLLEIFRYSINDSKERKNKTLMRIYNIINIPSRVNLFDKIKESFNLKSLKFIYSFKLALSISLSMFLVQYLNIQYGKWIVITIYVIMQPYKEDTVKKAKKRFIGTFIGVILFFVLFSIIHDTIPKVLILLVAFFYYFYFKDYEKKVMSMTIVSLSSISLVENINILSIDRFIFVTVGISIALLFNKYFLPYNISNSIEELKHKYKKNSKEISKEVDKVIRGKGSLDKVIKLSLIENKLENKLIANNEIVKDKNVEKLIYRQSMIMSDTRFLLLRHYYSNQL